MSDRSQAGVGAADVVRIALLPVTGLLALGVGGVFAHGFLQSKPFKLMEPVWLSPLLAIVGVACAVGSVALSWRLLRRFPYAMPIVAVSATVLSQVLLPSALLRLVIGGDGHGDFGWKEGIDFLLLEARSLITPAALVGGATGLIALGCRWIWSRA